MPVAHGQLKKKYRLGLTWPEYQKKIAAGEYQFHAFGSDGFAITEVIDFAEERVCIVHLVGGENSKAWKDSADQKLVEFAKRHNCKAIEAQCRFGVERVMKPMGWRRTRVVIRKDIQ